MYVCTVQGAIRLQAQSISSYRGKGGGVVTTKGTWGHILLSVLQCHCDILVIIKLLFGFFLKSNLSL